jgi:quercetin dioxygenase-like cupin family protein/DNA-binding XRE family transcriptional regulator
MSDDFLKLDVGGKLRRLREDNGLSVAELARRAALGDAAVRDFEDGRTVPAVGDLLKMGNVLGVSIGHFFQTRIPDKRVEVVRAADRWTVKARSEAAGALGYRYQSLSHGLTEKLMQPFLVEVPPGQDSALNRSQHEGEEFLFVLGGVLEVEIAGDKHRLEPGDSIYYDSRQPHTLRALEGATARLIACIAQHANVMKKSELDRAYR